MKRLILFTLIAFSCTIASAQSLNISYSPESTDLWGRTENASALKIEYLENIFNYKNIKISIGGKFHRIQASPASYEKQVTVQRKMTVVSSSTFTETYETTEKQRFHMGGTYNGGFFLTQFLLEDVVGNFDISQKLGVGYFDKKYPNSIHGVHINFNVSQTISTEINDNVSFGIEYNHISNAGTGDVNIGIDNIFVNMIITL